METKTNYEKLLVRHKLTDHNPSGKARLWWGILMQFN